ncbi:MAG TPA: hypothetical protein VHF26_00210 [Trebonia sp.]|nr:hypothetical protein [Trebonia sp.]
MERPLVAVPTRYACTAGPLGGRLVRRDDGTAERFRRAVADQAPGAAARVLAPGEPRTPGD